ncbi:MAG: hypothetical protein JO076_10320 [Verrucomicrobia bacterium]|nr:hypothetical protein [Verrucomicrobiota bacterium]
MQIRWSGFAETLSYLILAISALCSFAVSYSSPIFSYAEMDPRGSTLVAQAIVQHRTMRLDGYKLPSAPWLFEMKNGHVYSIYPLGTPLLVLPFVAIALNQGKDMQIDKVELTVQKQVAALTVVGFLLLAYFILRCFVEVVTSALLASLWTLGTGVMSTMGAALWSINFAVVFECLTLLFVVRSQTGKSKQLRPILVGLMLFAGYLCRPTAALLAVPVTILFWYRSRNAALKIVITFGVLFLVLCLFSMSEFHTWLPAYYSAYSTNLKGASFPHWRKVLYGLTFGPARGLFVYQPFLLLLLIALLFTVRKSYRKPLFWLAVIWIGLDILVVSRWPIWWGGGSFGSRLLVESFPAWVVLTGLVWSELTGVKEAIVPFALCFGIFAGLGIGINSYQGLYNWSTWEWNAMPDSLIGKDPPNNYDWRYPQFLANPEMITALKEKQSRTEKPNN